MEARNEERHVQSRFPILFGRRDSLRTRVTARIAWPAIQALGADSYSAAPRLPSAAAQTHQLKNGIVVFLQEDHELPFIYGSVLIHGGSRDEVPAKTGLVGLYSQAWRASSTTAMDGDAMDDLLESSRSY